MSAREQAQALLQSVPDYKIEYVIAFLQGVTAGEDVPNDDTIYAIEELKNGGGESFETLDELWASLDGGS